MIAAAASGRNAHRDSLLIEVLCCGLGIEETLALMPSSITTPPTGKAIIDIAGKKGKLKHRRCPIALADRLLAHAKRSNLSPPDRLFPIGGVRLWQIVTAAAQRAGLIGVTPRLLSQWGRSRHSSKTSYSEGVQGLPCETCPFRLFWRSALRGKDKAVLPRRR